MLILNTEHITCFSVNQHSKIAMNIGVKNTCKLVQYSVI